LGENEAEKGLTSLFAKD